MNGKDWIVPSGWVLAEINPLPSSRVMRNLPFCQSKPTKKTMTEFEYRTLKSYANSDLSELANLKLRFENKPIDPKAAQFGTTFHTMILEPSVVIDWSIHHVKEHARMLEMQKSFNLFTSVNLPGWPDFPHKVEEIRTWTDPVTGLPCKAKLDVCPDLVGSIYDLKTTSAKSEQDFFDKFETYGYDRQAAYYLDAFHHGHGYLSYDFVFIAVQKQKPFSVFMVDMGATLYRRTIIDNARKRNAFWLKKAQIELLDPKGWRPSAWSRKEGATV